MVWWPSELEPGQNGTAPQHSLGKTNLSPPFVTHLLKAGELHGAQLGVDQHIVHRHLHITILWCKNQCCGAGAGGAEII